MPYKDKELQAKYQKQWVAERRKKWLKDKVCIKCGSDTNLEIDHIDPTLKTSHRIWSWSNDKREAELSKCQVLCHNCHVKKTWPNETPHGVTKYRQGCRCEICKKAKSEATANRRARLGHR